MDNIVHMNKQTPPRRSEPLTMSSLYFFLRPWWRSLSWLAISLYWSLSCWQVSSSLDRMSRASFLLSSFRLHTRNYNKRRAHKDRTESGGVMRCIIVDTFHSRSPSSECSFQDHGSRHVYNIRLYHLLGPGLDVEAVKVLSCNWPAPSRWKSTHWSQVFKV